LRIFGTAEARSNERVALHRTHLARQSRGWIRSSLASLLGRGLPYLRLKTALSDEISSLVVMVSL
jgi:hypothetical protein